jgi:histidinol dehydrogenase
MEVMEVFMNPARDSWPGILERPEAGLEGIRSAVTAILDRVRSGGDRALIDLTEEFDGIRPDDLQLPREKIREAAQKLPDDLKKAIATAMHNIKRFHENQQTEDRLVTTSPGVRCWTRTVPIEKVGLYIPGGSAPLLSTVLMLGIPAMLAGCTEIILCTPPGENGEVHPAILYCADLIGAAKVFRVGGAQAVAAMAYGTESIPAVDKIFGPGNPFVTLAKQLVSLDGPAIDMPAGPSELAIIADDTADPAIIAADHLSQAEHGPDSQVLLVTSSASIVKPVQEELEKQLSLLPRRDLAMESLSKSRLVVLEKRQDVLDMINEYAPEHLIIMCRDYGEAGIQIRNAGSVFMGPYTPESAGDYASGTNHTLPTGGYARAYSGLGLADFQKKISFQEISGEGLKDLAPAIIRMAEEEELQGHAKAVEIRLSKT